MTTLNIYLRNPAALLCNDTHMSFEAIESGAYLNEYYLERGAILIDTVEIDLTGSAKVAVDQATAQLKKDEAYHLGKLETIEQSRTTLGLSK